MALQLNCGSLIIKVTPSHQVEFQSMFHFVLFGVMVPQSQQRKKIKCPIWDNGVSKSIEKENFINSDTSKYLKFWTLNIVRDEMYAKAMGPYIEYWECIFKCLSKPLPKQSHILLEGFWHLAIGKLIMCNSLFQLQLLLKIRNFQLSLYIVGLKT